MGSSLAHAKPLHQVSWKWGWSSFQSCLHTDKQTDKQNRTENITTLAKEISSDQTRVKYGSNQGKIQSRIIYYMIDKNTYEV